MWNVMMEVDGKVYKYGSYEDRDRANEVAMKVRDERNIWVFVEWME